MFTPQEIQEQTFSKAVFGGYDMQQVDDFLEPLTEDYITLYKENSVLKAKMKILVEKLEEYRAQETQQSSATAEAEAKSAQLLKQTQAKCAAMLQNAEVNAQANAQVNAANVQLAQLNQQIHAEQERLDYAKQTALNFISVIERDVQGHLGLLETLKSRDLTKEEAAERAEMIRSVTAQWLSRLDENASEYDKVKAVYETIIFSTDYDLGAADNQNIASVFLGGASVCQGYAKATQYLLNHLGMMCTLVQGTVDTGEAHAWNLVRVDGAYYYVDTTWGDASYRMEDGSEQGTLPEINYDYLCVTTEDLLRTHRIDSVIPLPECTATEANYYVREGAYFTSCDREQMQEVFDRAAAEGRTDVTLKCADDSCYQDICHTLIDEQEIFSYLHMEGNGNTVTYAQNGKQLSLTFWVTNE